MAVWLLLDWRVAHNTTAHAPHISTLISFVSLRFLLFFFLWHYGFSFGRLAAIVSSSFQLRLLFGLFLFVCRVLFFLFEGRSGAVGGAPHFTTANSICSARRGRGVGRPRWARWIVVRDLSLLRKQAQANDWRYELVAYFSWGSCYLVDTIKRLDRWTESSFLQPKGWRNRK